MPYLDKEVIDKIDNDMLEFERERDKSFDYIFFELPFHIKRLKPDFEISHYIYDGLWRKPFYELFEPGTQTFQLFEALWDCCPRMLNLGYYSHNKGNVICNKCRQSGFDKQTPTDLHLYIERGQNQYVIKTHCYTCPYSTHNKVTTPINPEILIEKIEKDKALLEEFNRLKQLVTDWK